MMHKFRRKPAYLMLTTFFIFLAIFAGPLAASQEKEQTVRDAPAIKMLKKGTATRLSLAEQSVAIKKLLNEETRHPEAIKEFIHSLKGLKCLLEEMQADNDQGISMGIHGHLLKTKMRSLIDLEAKVTEDFRVRRGYYISKGRNRVVTKMDERHQRLARDAEPIFRLGHRILTENDPTAIRSLIGELHSYFVNHISFEPLAQELPKQKPAFRTSDFKPIKPNLSGRVIPAYRKTAILTGTLASHDSAAAIVKNNLTGADIGQYASALPEPADLSETVEVQITAEIIALAASLGNSPSRIFEWVKNNIKVEFYYGSLKGSVGTLMERAGNDMDTASLLLALFRAAGIPSRYVTGTIEISVNKAIGLTNITNPEQIGTFLNSAGIPSTAIISGSTIVAFQLDHTWAEAYVDYLPYAGAKAGTGDLWVPLAPWYKTHDYTSGMDLVTASGFDSDAFLDAFITIVKTVDPAEAFTEYLDDYLRNNDPGKNWQDGTGESDQIEENFRTLPITLNFLTLDIDGEYAEIPDSLRHKVLIDVPAASLSYILNLCETVGKKLTYSFPGYTAQDRQDIDENNGIPPAGVDMVPTLKLEGTVVAESPGLANPGIAHLLYTDFWVPGQGWDSVVYTLLTGGYYAIGLDPQFVSNTYLSQRIANYVATLGDVTETSENRDDITGEALYLAVMKYFNDVNTSDRIFSSLYHTACLKQTSGTITGKDLRVYYYQGYPYYINDGGYYVDARHHIYTPVSITGDADRERDFTLLRGYSGSYHEHALFQEFFLMDAISTVKLLSLANELGMPIYDIDSSNANTLIPLLTVDSSVKTEIQNAVTAGKIVKIHQDNISEPGWDWVGCGYIIRDPVSNAADYMLSGGMAGGHTTSAGPRDPVKGPGLEPGEETLGDPVNPSTGNLLVTDIDFSVDSRGMPMEMIRYYNSQSDAAGPVGHGWTFTYSDHIIENPDESVTIVTGNGTRHTFAKSPQGDFTPPAGIFSTLEKTISGYTVRSTKGLIRRFDTAGRLTAIEDPNANAMAFTYTGNQLTGIEDTVGRTCTISYNGEGRMDIVSIDAPSPGPFTWTYSYDGNGDLVTVTNPRGHTKSYGYDAGHNLVTMTFYEGGVFAYDYYSDDRVHTNTLPNGGQFIYSYYNTDLRITILQDPKGHKTVFSYDEDGALIGMMDPLGFEERYTLDANKQKLKITDKRGNSRKMTYDAVGNMSSLTNELNQTTSYNYEPDLNRMTSVTDALGRTTVYRYDTGGNLIEVEAPSGETTYFTYDANGDLLTNTDAAGNTTIYTRDGYGYLASITDALGKTAYFIYDFLGNPISKTDKNGSNSNYVYDLKLCVQATDAAGKTTHFEYDKNCNLITTTDPLGNLFKNTYDLFNSLMSRIDSLDNQTTFVYDLNRHLVGVTDANGHMADITYDALGRRIRKADALGIIAEFGYDPNGNLTRVTDANGNVTVYEHDALNRRIRSIYPDGSTQSYSYDEVGNLISQTDQEGRITTWTYDDRNRIVTKTDALNHTTHYGYAPNGNRTSIEDDIGRVTTFGYDAVNRLTSITYPDTVQMTYTYDDAGNQLSRTDRSGNVVSYTYDGLRNVTAKDLPGDADVTYTYDPLSRLLTAADSWTTNSYSYDAIGRVTQFSSGSDTVGYIYDGVGNLIRLDYPDGTYVTYEYDSRNRMTAVKGPTGETIAGFTYDALNRRIRTDLANGTKVFYAHNRMNRLTHISNTDTGSGTAASDIGYTYNLSGNRTSMTTENGTYAFSYDQKHQLIGYDRPDASAIAFAYDALGNRTTVTQGTGTAYTVNQLNQYSAIGGITQTYDTSGNLTHDGVNTYTYSPENRLATATTSAGGVNFSYDPEGRRAAKTDADGTTRFVYAGERVIMEKDGSGTVTATYVYGSGIDEILRMTRNGSVYYYHRDGLNSVVKVTDGAGTPVESYEYDVFGQPSFFDGTGTVQSQSAIGNAYLFTGRRFDVQTGLYFYRERYYSPTTGRFTSMDPVGYMGGLNLYNYVFNDPVNLVDPFGLYWNYGGGYNDPEKLNGKHTDDADRTAELTDIMDLIKEYGEFRYYAGSHLDAGNCTKTYPDFVEWYEDKYNQSIDSLNSSYKYYEIQQICGGIQPSGGDAPASYGHYSMGIVDKNFKTNRNNINSVVSIYDPIGHPTVVNYDLLAIMEGLTAQAGVEQQVQDKGRQWGADAWRNPMIWKTEVLPTYYSDINSEIFIGDPQTYDDPVFWESMSQKY